ncbi:hypothetical protein K1T35_47955 (plasmid) [Pseudonocardia sp. DSM 110487]|uniref:hypothetical protein n=1 Tax=Pseudonocardia sp. DSM 110487 TaxID=2865833 RepID=UPI001C69A2A7|nr:hypothetical protein [Pseudonocardia sp. DSM 110487]QYN41086.1 hypothetical protein K1T35_47955 [Pseudonocardia sp. DSM 110487]
MTISAERTHDEEASATDLVLRREGAELVVRPENVLTRLATHPLTARALSASRTAAGHTAKAMKGTARGVAAFAVTAPASRVGGFAVRFLSGQILIGGPRTDATFWRAGRHQFKDVPGNTGKWSYRPGWARLLFRLGILLIVAAVAYWVAPETTRTVATVLGVIALVWGSWGGWHRVKTHAHHKRHLRPLHEALRTSVKQTAARPEEWLHIPPDFKHNSGQELRIDLPRGYDGSDGVNNHVKTVVRGKLGLDSDTQFAWNLEGAKPYVLIREPSRPPAKVTYEDILSLLQKAKETAPIIGLAAGEKPVDVDLDADSPHVLVSAGSGAGKSVLLRGILAQGLAKGGLGIICDVKRVSHMWANNLPNVRYRRTAEAIHEQLLSLKDEIDRRTILVEEHADIDGNTDHIYVGPRIWVMLEEMNATINRLNTYWRQIKEKGDPNMSPAVEALLDILFMGRQIKVHVVAVAQSATARAVGGPEGRENFATRCLARYTANAWRMLVPEVWPMPKKSKHIGRWQIVKHGVATETQVAFFTPRECREMALLGLPADERADFEPESVPVSQLSQDRPDLGQRPETVPGTPSADPQPADSLNGDEIIEARRLVSLREAVETDLVDGMSLDNLRKARQRYVDFPEVAGKHGQTDLFDAKKLGEFARNRRMSTSHETE